MPQRHRVASAAAAVALWITALGGPPAAAQQSAPPTAEGPQSGQEIQLVLSGATVQRHRLAFPAVEGGASLAGAARAAAAELEEALRGDLERSGVFEVQGPAELAVLQLTGDEARDRELYRSLGNEVLLRASVAVEGERLVLEGRVFDLRSGEAILGKRYRGTFDLARRIAHAFNDEIVLYFSGRRGIATTTLAFTSDRTGDKEIFLMDYDGHAQRRVTGHRSISLAPDWSPPGDAIAYVSFYGGPPGIYLIDLEAGLKRPVLADGPMNTAPSFSPDGQRLAFSRSLRGNTEIFVCNRDGTGLRQLTHASGIDTNPAWSPTGNEIAFTSDRAGNPHIYVMDAEGANLRRVTFEGSYNDGAAWSPDGSRLAYASRRSGSSFDIAVSDLATLESRLVTSGPGSSESPTISPDGRRIAFAYSPPPRQGRSTQIFVIDAGGGAPIALTSEGNNSSPSWSGYPRR